MKTLSGWETQNAIAAVIERNPHETLKLMYDADLSFPLDSAADLTLSLRVSPSLLAEIANEIERSRAEVNNDGKN